MAKKKQGAVSISRLAVKGLLSFGADGIDLPLRPLNVLIGANGSGKSNLVDVLALLRATPDGFRGVIESTGGIANWLWKGAGQSGEAAIEAECETLDMGRLRHTLPLRSVSGAANVAGEKIRGNSFQYQEAGRHSILTEKRTTRQLEVRPDESVLAQVKDPDRYQALSRLRSAYSGIEIFRSWSFGPYTHLRHGLSSHGSNKFLRDDSSNLAPVLSSFRGDVKQQFLDALKKAYEGISEWGFEMHSGSIHLYVDEGGGVRIPATRLSDGTLRYLCLLAILLHPAPPSMIAIEEPELGLHPDLMPTIARLLIDASSKTQLLVTTHSKALVDALTPRPDTVIVCEKTPRGSTFQRLDARRLSAWLEKYSLGDLWTSGEIGGNRW